MMNLSRTLNQKKKTTQGRKKIEIKKIDNVSNRQVTFSKRRAGLFKKASELCILTGAEVAIIVQSSGKRVYSFGHPSVDGVIERYYNTKGSEFNSAAALTSSSSSRNSGAIISAAEMQEHNLEYNRLCRELEGEKKKIEFQEKAKFVNNGGSFWWDEPVDHLGLEELELYAAALEELMKNALIRADELALLTSSQTLVMDNDDLNQTMANTVGVGFSCGEDDDLIMNIHGSHYCSSSTSIFNPYEYHVGNPQI